MKRKIIAIILIIILTMADILLIGMNLMEVISVEEPPIVGSEITKEIYKGYFYQGRQKETRFEEKIVMNISNIEAITEMKFANKEQNYIAYSENEEKISYEAIEDIIVKETIFSKENFLEILGENGEVIIKNQEEEEIAKITNETEVDENGNVVIIYEDKQVSKLLINTTKPIKEGQLIFNNKKAILANSQYTKEQLKQFKAFEEQIEVNEELMTLSMELLDTKAEAEIEMTQTNLSTLKKNENIQMVAMLKTNQIQYDLYKNPYIEIIFPSTLQVDIKSINQINSPFMQIQTAQTTKNEKGETILQLQLEGEQTEFEDTIVEGIQIVMSLDIKIDILTPSQRSEIVMRYTNENRQNETCEAKKAITLQSKEGAFLVNRISNYNQSGEILETTNDKVKVGKLDCKEKARIATVEYYLLNNGETAMNQVTMVGRLENLQGTVQERLVSLIELEKQGARIYYAKEDNISENSEDWQESVEDITEMKSFKIVIEEEIKPQEVIKISYQMEIAENLEPSKTAKNTLEVNYLQEGKQMNITSSNELQTPELLFSEVETKTEEKKEITVQMAVVSEGKALKDGDEVKEGQTIRYTLQVTNNKKTPINNFKMVATHSNVIYYGVRMEDAFGEEYPHIDEQEDLENKELTIETIEPGETVTLQYQIVAEKEAEEGAKTTGEIVLSGEGIEETRIQAYENPIKQGKLRLKLLCGYAENQTVYSNYYAYPLELYVENIAGEDLSNIDLKLDKTEFLGFETKNFGYTPKEIDCSLKNIVDNELQIHIEKLEKGKEVILFALCYTKPLDIEIAKVDLNLDFSTTIDGENYTSNELTDKILQAQSKITAIQSGSVEGKYVEDGDNLIYTTKIKNEGAIDFKANISDTLPRGVNIKGAYTIKEGKKQTIDNIVYQTVLKNGILLKPQEEMIFVVETTIDASIVNGDTITNIVDVSGFESNEITYQVKKQEPENPEGPEEPSEPSEEVKKAIYGTAWVDENSDGIKDNGERKIANMEVYLFNQQDGMQVAKTTTNENGKYAFEKIAQGKYFVVFNYDNTKYQVTQYQREGTNSSKNSDVIEKEIKLDGQTKKVAMTEGLELLDINLLNIDAGFIQGKVFDLKVDKYIHKITIQSKEGTIVKEYGKTQMAKLELKSKTIENSNILIEYQIDVKNEGEVLGYVEEIIDDMPKDLVFSEQNNKNWYQTTDGKLITKELANQIISPGETKTVTLILSKTMNQNNIGISSNTAEIIGQSNALAIKDINDKNDKSTAEVIVSIATGEIILKATLLTIIIAAILGIGVYFINRKVLKTN